MKQALDLLDQILVIAHAQAADLDAYNIMRHKALKTVGKNAVVHNLEMLRELLVLEQEKMTPKPLYDVMDFVPRTCGIPAGMLAEWSKARDNDGTVKVNGMTYNVAYGTGEFRSPPLPDWADKLPEVSDVGKRARIISHHWADKTWFGREGVIVKHYVNADDCGDWGKLYYEIQDDNGSYFSVRCEYCELC